MGAKHKLPPATFRSRSRRQVVLALPLKARSTRVLLLAWSYLDARFAVRGDGRAAPRGGFRVPLPERNRELWPRGSYPRFEDALEALRIADQRGYEWFWRRFVDAPGPFDPGDADELAECPELAFVTGRMRATVHVPMWVSYSAGYPIDQAKEWAKAWDAREVTREVYGNVR